MAIQRSTGSARRVALIAGSLLLLQGLLGFSTSIAAAAGPSVYATTAAGTSSNPGSFTSADDVFLGASSCPATTDVLPPGDYLFEVADQTGTQALSLDSDADRQFTVGPDGAITTVTAHETGLNLCPGGPGGATIRLMPFGPLPAGQTQYSVRVAAISSANGVRGRGPLLRRRAAVHDVVRDRTECRQSQRRANVIGRAVVSSHRITRRAVAFGKRQPVSEHGRLP